MSKMEKLDWKKVKVGDVLRLRCGGKVVLRFKKLRSGSKFHPVEIKIEGYHAMASTCSSWFYNAKGQHGEGTGPIYEYPFDVMGFYPAKAQS